MHPLKLLRIAFFGTTKFATQHLYTIVQSKIYQIAVIFTQSKKQHFYNAPPFSIEQIAKKYNFLLFQYTDLNLIKIAQIIKILNVNIIIIVSCGLILSQEILDIPKFGCINIHGSLLPRWRGPAPIQRALEYGDSTTGISIIKVDAGIDTGHILKTVSCNISPKDTTNTLSEKLAKIGSTALLHVLKEITLGTQRFTPQHHSLAVYAPKLQKKEARIDWSKSAHELERRIRAFNPWPICFFLTKNNFIRIWDATVRNNQATKHYSQFTKLRPGTILMTDKNGIHVITGDGILILTTLQIPGKKITSTQDILNARKTWFTPYSTVLE